MIEPPWAAARLPAAIRPVTISLNLTRVSPGRAVPWAGQRSLQSTRDGPRGSAKFGPGPLQPTQANLWYWYFCSRPSIGKTRRRDADDQTQPLQPWAKRPRFGPRTGSAARLEKQHLFYFVLNFLVFSFIVPSVCRLCTECSRCLKFELKKNRGVVVMHFPNLVVMHLSDRFLLAFFVRNAILLNRFTDNATCRS